LQAAAPNPVTHAAGFGFNRAYDCDQQATRHFLLWSVYSFNGEPEGPFPVAQFEVNLSTPAQFGAFVRWIAVWRGPLSVLVHPNTTKAGDEAPIERRNHWQRAMWMGERIPLDGNMWEGSARQWSGTTGRWCHSSRIETGIPMIHEMVNDNAMVVLSARWLPIWLLQSHR
jgi:aromatic ring-cleaving dioxygenase